VFIFTFLISWKWMLFTQNKQQRATRIAQKSEVALNYLYLVSRLSLIKFSLQMWIHISRHVYLVTAWASLTFRLFLSRHDKLPVSQINQLSFKFSIRKLLNYRAKTPKIGCTSWFCFKIHFLRIDVLWSHVVHKVDIDLFPDNSIRTSFTEWDERVDKRRETINLSQLLTYLRIAAW
jgi:hypothetical protein